MNTFLFTCLYIHLHIYRHPWDVWSSLALDIFSRPEWWTRPCSLYFFKFLFIFLKQLPPQKWPFIVIVQLQIFGVLPCTPNWLKNMKWWPRRLIESFNSDRENMKMWQCKEGLFDVSLWHKYETTCQCAELEQIIFLLKMTFKMMFT